MREKQREREEGMETDKQIEGKREGRAWGCTQYRVIYC